MEPPHIRDGTLRDYNGIRYNNVVWVRSKKTPIIIVLTVRIHHLPQHEAQVKQQLTVVVYIGENASGDVNI